MAYFQETTGQRKAFEVTDPSQITMYRGSAFHTELDESKYDRAKNLQTGKVQETHRKTGYGGGEGYGDGKRRRPGN